LKNLPSSFKKKEKEKREFYIMNYKNLLALPLAF